MAFGGVAHAGKYFYYHFEPWFSVLGRDGNFYGNVLEGGLRGAGGSVYRLTPGGDLQIVTSFPWSRHMARFTRTGHYPEGALSVSTDGAIYGCTRAGGAFGSGVVYKVAPNGRRETLYHLQGGYYKAGVLTASNGDIYVAAYESPILRIAPDGSTTEIARPETGLWPQIVETATGKILLTDYAVQYATQYGAPGTGRIYRFNESGQFEVLADVGVVYERPLALADGSVVVASENKLRRVYEDGRVEALHEFAVPFQGQGPYGLFLTDHGQSVLGTTGGGGLERLGTVFRLGLGTHEYTVLKHREPYGRRGPGPHWVLEVLPFLRDAAAENHPPMAHDDFVEAWNLHADTSSGGLPAARIHVLANDRDADRDTLQGLTIIEQPSHGTAVVNADLRTVSYTADSAEQVWDTFAYSVNDGSGGTSRAWVVVRPNRAAEYTGEVVSEVTPTAPDQTHGSLYVRVSKTGVFGGVVATKEKAYSFSGHFNDHNVCGVPLAFDAQTGESVGIQLWMKPNGAQWEIHVEILGTEGRYTGACTPVTPIP